MGLFNKKETCSICGDKNGKPISDGFVCDNCWEACGCFKLIGQNRKLARIIDVQERLKENKLCNKLQKERSKIFTPNKIIGDKILVDETHKLWSPTKGLVSKKTTDEYFSYDDVISFEVVEDGNTVTKGGLGRAVVGGILLGGVGAIVGGATSKKKTRETCNRLFLKLRVAHFPRDIILIYISMNEVKKDSGTYKACYYQMEQVLNFFNDIKNGENKTTTSANNDLSTELQKYHDLLESGAISEDEYSDIKNKLLAKI